MVSKIANNLINRILGTHELNQKWYTDVREFNLRGEKISLSPIIDGYNPEVKLHHMLDIAFEGNMALERLIFYSEQGWQY